MSITSNTSIRRAILAVTATAAATTMVACSHNTASRYQAPQVALGEPQPYTDDELIVAAYAGNTNPNNAAKANTAATLIESGTVNTGSSLAGGSNNTDSYNNARQTFFDPFNLDLAVDHNAHHAALAPTFAEVTPLDQTKARRYIDAATVLYGEAPGTARATGRDDDALVLDGLESLQQTTFATEGADFDPCISRDGSTIVFASTQHRATSDIYVKPVKGTTLTQLTADPAHDLMPAISPDGSRIAFTSNRLGSWDIFVMSAEGGQAAQLTTTSAHELHPSWSPDGSQLVFSRLGEVSGRWEMWVMDIDQPVVTEFIGYGLFPEWCPVAGTGAHGRDQILFQRSRERSDRRFSVWTIEYKRDDASSPTEVVASQHAAIINPSWSFDGLRVAFATVPNPESSGMHPDARPVSSDLWMIDADGSNRVNLTKGRYVNLMPTWSPSGRVFFVSDREGVDNIWSIRTNKAIIAATGRAPAVNTEFAEVPLP